jgi:hypothetical protein
MSHSGHQRRFDVGGMSAIAPIATKMLRRDERRKGPEAEESYCVMVAGAAFLCSGHVFLLPTKGKRSIEEDREQIDRITTRKACCVVWRKRY